MDVFDPTVQPRDPLFRLIIEAALAGAVLLVPAVLLLQGRLELGAGPSSSAVAGDEDQPRHQLSGSSRVADQPVVPSAWPAVYRPATAEQRSAAQPEAPAALRLPEFSASWAQRDYYDWISTGQVAADFTLSARAHAEAAGELVNLSHSGCGFVFRLNARGDHYLVLYAMDGWVYLYRNLSGIIARLAQSYSTALAELAGPTAVSLTAQGESIRAAVEGEEVLAHQADTLPGGLLGYAIASGTNRDFGIRCTMTEVVLQVLATD